jgi:hypothetical protein
LTPLRPAILATLATGDLIEPAPGRAPRDRFN